MNLKKGKNRETNKLAKQRAQTSLHAPSNSLGEGLLAGRGSIFKTL